MVCLQISRMKASLLDNLQNKLRFNLPRNLMMISGFGLGIGAVSLIFLTLMILVTHKISSSSSSLFFILPNSSLISWSLSLPNAVFPAINDEHNATHLENLFMNKTHYTNLDSEVKNVSFHSQEPRFIVNGGTNYAKNSSGYFKNGTQIAKGCDIFDGKWVRDDTLPHYPPGSCPYIDTDFNCHLNGRIDTGFYRWKWQPIGCKIPRLNATDFLERLRGKKLVFVGDSLNRNMWESLVCILRHSIKHKKRVYEISGKREFKKEGTYAFRFEDYNCSVDYVRAPFLVTESTFHGKNGSFATLRLDLMDQTTKMYRDAHVLVFNTGHWWTHEKTSRGEDYYQEGNYVHPRLKALEAYKKALTTWGRWIDRHVNRNKTLVLFRGYSNIHFRGGQWNSGGQCHKETEPIFNKTYLGNYPSKMRALEHVLGKMRTPVVYLNISMLTDYRKDAHPSIYRKSYKTAKELSEAEQSQDCSHWCLPGVPDIWNELLYASLLKVGWGSSIPRH